MCRVDKYGFPRTTATQSEQAFYQNATSNSLLVKKLVRCNPIPFVEWISAKERGYGVLRHIIIDIIKIFIKLLVRG